jgi:broad specificity phosphatase PhoE/ribonuclease HI
VGPGGARVARVVVEADGGSRGNPGPAAYGSVLRNADTGEVIAQRAEVIGVASNNVAEYRGLIGGLELVAEHAPGAEVEVRMDSKLVIEQMAGRWKIKHPDMKPLALRAQRLTPTGVRWTWVPRERNKAADAILNEALDEAQGVRPRHRPGAPPPDEPADPTALAAGERVRPNPLVGWRGQVDGTPTTVLLLRHGVTANTRAKMFCGSGGLDPGLLEAGREQAARAASWLSRRGGMDAVVTSPLRRTRETAQVVADQLGLDVAVEDGLAEAAFGRWDGLSLAEVHERFPDELDAWLHDTSVAPPGGESFESVSRRAVLALDRLLEQYAGRTLVAVSHVTPIKMLVRAALDAPMHVIYRMELAPASLTTIQWWPDGTPSLRAFSYVPD